MINHTREVVTGGRARSDRYTYVPALRVGKMVFISVTTGTDDEGQIKASGDIVEQTRQIFRNFERLLRSVGDSCDDIVETPTENFRKTADIRREFFTRGFPTSTGVIVAGLLREGAVIEISAIAVVGSETR